MSEKPTPQRHPDLEGYVSRRAERTAARPRWLPQWIPANHNEWVRFRINTRLWVVFTGSVRAQMIAGTLLVGTSSYLFICWVDNVSPYLAVSEDPNTAFKHPHWQQMANDRVARERELKRRIASSTVTGDGKFSALDHATKAYSSQNAGDRLS